MPGVWWKLLACHFGACWMFNCSSRLPNVFGIDLLGHVLQWYVPAELVRCLAASLAATLTGWWVVLRFSSLVALRCSCRLSPATFAWHFGNFFDRFRCHFWLGYASIRNYLAGCLSVCLPGSPHAACYILASTAIGVNFHWFAGWQKIYMWKTNKRGPKEKYCWKLKTENLSRQFHFSLSSVLVFCLSAIVCPHLRPTPLGSWCQSSSACFECRQQVCRLSLLLHCAQSILPRALSHRLLLLRKLPRRAPNWPKYKYRSHKSKSPLAGIFFLFFLLFKWQFAHLQLLEH